MGMMLVHEEDVRQILRDTLERFDDANLASEAAREAIISKAMDGIKHNGDNLDGQSFIKSHEN